MTHPFESFGIYLFDEHVMKERLPYPIYKKWKTASCKEDALDRPTADAIAHAMKTWAMELGATHFSHWFQPMSGLTAQKQDSFIEPGEYGQAIARFSGKSLIKGEGDASSFANGGLRATFEARGYTYWDCTSPAFLKNHTLYIPTIFVSYNGEMLDKKAPLLKSIEVLSAAATSILHSFKQNDVKRVIPMVGLEQEYFLIDKKLYLQRNDLMHCGRTLFGSMAPKGDFVSQHYFGSIPLRVETFMKDVDEALWKLGIYAKTQHNEVAPCQFEIAPLFCDCNIAVDQNLIIMDTLKEIADKHGFACLLHEKPFAHVNGSGKHNNYSLVTDDGQNLFEPGDRPQENIRFLLFVCALIQAVDTYPELLRLASSSYSNDYRLGGDEAPLPIISICMGSYLEEVLEKLESGDNCTIEVETIPFDVGNLAYIPKDTSDRNRTSPFAFTGNKFEFRMVGSSLSASTTNVVLNTILADTFQTIADQLSKFKYIDDIRSEALAICRRILKQHKKILFSKDGYSETWKQEAQKRQLPHIPSYVYAIEAFTSSKTTALFQRNHIYQPHELQARTNILYDEVIKTIQVEAKVLLNAMKQSFLPAIIKELQMYTSSTIKHPYFMKQKTLFYEFITQIDEQYEKLQEALTKVNQLQTKKEQAYYMNDQVAPQFLIIRSILDAIEQQMSSNNYPFPTYEQLFTSIHNTDSQECM